MFLEMFGKPVAFVHGRSWSALTMMTGETLAM